MIYKVLFQEKNDDNPTRESTKSIYIDAKNMIDGQDKLEKTNYNVESINELVGEFLEFEQNEPNYKITEL